MPELIAKSALFGNRPLTLAATTLAEAALGAITSIAPFPGQGPAVSARLGGWPAPNRWLAAPFLVWTGPDQAFLIGAPAPDLAGLAALTDQSGGWAALSLGGPLAERALARLYPLDLRPRVFGPGHCARAPLGHMQSVLIRREQDFVLLVFRSMARSAWKELAEALEHVAARAAL